MTREDYDELKRLYDHTRAIVVYRNPNTSKCFSIALSGAAAVTDADLSFLKDGEAVHIPTAIAEMESAEKPMTQNDWITNATIKERAKILSRITITCPPNGCTRKTACKPRGCEDCWEEYLNSPYTEGETK